MKLEGPGKALSILIMEEDRWEGRVLHEEIVRQAKESGLAGASVFRGFLSFGAAGSFHDANIEVLMTNLPLSVVIVDTVDKIDAFLPALGSMIGEGLMQTWDVNVEFYRDGKSE